MSDETEIRQRMRKAIAECNVRDYEKAQGELDALTASDSFHRARLNDVTVQKMLSAGKSLEAIIGQLALDKDYMMRRIMELENIAPRKVVMPDGRVMVWRCPDDFIPTRLMSTRPAHPAPEPKQSDETPGALMPGEQNALDSSSRS